MIIYFSGTGNSLATARKIAEATGDKVMRMAEAVGQDLSSEECVGLVYPSYDFAPPPAVKRMLPALTAHAVWLVFTFVRIKRWNWGASRSRNHGNTTIQM